MIPSKLSAPFYAAYFAVLGVVLPLLGPYLEHRGVAAVGIGLITALFSLPKLIYAPVIGARVDRGLWFAGVLSLHMAVSVAAAVAVPYLRGPWGIAAAFFTVGLGYGTVLPLVEAAVLERLPRGGYGALRLWGSLGFITAATAGAAVVARAGLSAFPTLLAVAMAVLAMTCLPLEGAARPARGSARGGRIPAVVWCLLALLTLHQLAHGPYYAFFSIHVLASGFGSGTVSALWSLGVVAELAAFLGGARLEGRLGRLRVLGAALALSPVRWLLLALPPSAMTLVAAQLGHAVTFALVHLAGIQVIQAGVPAGAVRRTQALYSGLTFGLGVVAGSALAGPLYGAFGGRASFLAAAGLSCVLAVAWLPLSLKLKVSR